MAGNDKDLWRKGTCFPDKPTATSLVSGFHSSAVLSLLTLTLSLSLSSTPICFYHSECVHRYYPAPQKHSLSLNETFVNPSNTLSEVTHFIYSMFKHMNSVVIIINE